MFVARDSETHIVIEAKFFLGSPEKALKLRSGQERDGNNVSGPVSSDVDDEVSLGNVEGEPDNLVFIVDVAMMFLSQAGAALHHLLDHCLLRRFVGFRHAHFGKSN